MIRKKNPKKEKTSTLKNKLDKQFKAMIRGRDEIGPCISCLERMVTEAGHFISCRFLSTRWHPENVNGQCNYCNCFLSGNQYAYGLNLDRKFGSGTADKMRQLSRISWKPDREALENLLEAAKVGPEQYLETWEFYGAKL